MTDGVSIFLANLRPDVKALRKQMEDFKPLFSDMVMPEIGEIPYKSIIINVNPMEDDMNGCFRVRGSEEERRVEVEIDIRTKTGKHCGPKLLHEMIHFHEVCMKAYPESFRDHLEEQLLDKLSNRMNIYPLMDMIFGENDLIGAMCLMITFGMDSLMVPNFPRDTHGRLFFLKSLDLDIQRRYKLGTIYGYGMKEYLETTNLC